MYEVGRKRYRTVTVVEVCQSQGMSRDAVRTSRLITAPVVAILPGVIASRSAMTDRVGITIAAEFRKACGWKGGEAETP